MKTVREILRETNTASGLGVRGLGNVTGDPKVPDGSSSHYIVSNQQFTHQLQGNMASNLYGITSDDWWMEKPDIKKYHAKTGKVFTKTSKVALKEGSDHDHYEAIDDVHVNLGNRNHAIDEYGYGPLNPNEKNKEFWEEKAKLWKTTTQEAMKSRCGNCAAFNKSKEIVNKISSELGPAGKVITEKADLGFCEMFHFKCAAARTCDAWLVNGPIQEEMNVGAIAGTGDERLPPSQREPGVSPNNKYRKENEKEAPIMGEILRRPMFEVKKGKFAGNDTFLVPEEVFYEARLSKQKGKHWTKYLNETDYGKVIREYANKNPKKAVILQCEKTGYMCYARYGSK